ncbi:hypothetical protein BT67DRAFT_443789 [Trichocladium antarcticum]|uniref:Uncharacterized protein n=1 Tax=Trichocladium antarcticum TaxID=1450529 RepID=A0AAN6UH87_9PEZI|nr:hypothetical protein BT67DRAFT_443789 [Trichocladium antarcticum]
MCIRLHIHRMACDVRPFLAIARHSRQGRLSIQHINPYATPLQCPHHHHRRHSSHWHPEPGAGAGTGAGAKAMTGNCPHNGCCALQTLDLPCDCDGGPRPHAWDDHGNVEGLTRCAHFRDYHQYVFQAHPAVVAAGGAEQSHDAGEDGWAQYPVLDGWVAGEAEAADLRGRDDGRLTDWFCEGEEWRRARDAMFKVGRMLDVVVRRADRYQEVLCAALSGPDGEDGVDEEELSRVREEMAKVWSDAWVSVSGEAVLLLRPETNHSWDEKVCSVSS